MAHAAGLPARTITGLVYAEAAGPGFYFHAWNEVLVDGYWQRVDPTLGTTRVAATHIPFPEGTRAFLEAYAAFAIEGIEVRDLVYSDS
jgi:transglutaminase-like putative cysteine protease